MSYFKEMEERIEGYEKQGDFSLIQGLPIMIRFDGSSFSKFTKGLNRPFDQRLTDLMIEACKFIVEHTNARCGFVGSDEITIVLYEDDINSQTMYGGRVCKPQSELAAKLSVRFNKLLPDYLLEKVGLEPYFDAKCWNVPGVDEVANCFLVRENSVTKNAITMAALTLFSTNELKCVNGKDKQEMMFSKGINFNDYPVSFKRGVYVQKKKEFKKFSTEELDKLPTKHKARVNPDLEVERSVFHVVELPILSKIKNRVDVLLYGVEPIV